MHNYFQTETNIFYMLLIMTSGVAIIFHTVLMTVHCSMQKKHSEEMIGQAVEMQSLPTEDWDELHSWTCLLLHKHLNRAEFANIPDYVSGSVPDDGRQAELVHPTFGGRDTINDQKNMWFN